MAYNNRIINWLAAPVAAKSNLMKFDISEVGVRFQLDDFTLLLICILSLMVIERNTFLSQDASSIGV